MKLWNGNVALAGERLHFALQIVQRQNMPVLIFFFSLFLFVFIFVFVFIFLVYIVFLLSFSLLCPMPFFVFSLFPLLSVSIILSIILSPILIIQARWPFVAFLFSQDLCNVQVILNWVCGCVG